MKTQITDLLDKSLVGISQAQKERLAYIEFRLYFLGEFSRQDLSARFGMAPAGATRDIAQYKRLFPENIGFDSASKRYTLGKNFQAMFEHVPERVLSVLSHGFGDGVATNTGALVNCEFPMTFNSPVMSVLAPVTRAIHQKSVVGMRYYSHTSGQSTREIVPFALVNDGLRWHVRAFDRKSQEFRDFVLTRMENAVAIEGAHVEKHERPAEDNEWNRVVELKLVPHPDRKQKAIIERDYGMTDGLRRIKVRAAIAGYLLLHWIVDCSADHRLKGEEYRLWLMDDLALYGVSSAKFAPGYSPPRAK